MKVVARAILPLFPLSVNWFIELFLLLVLRSRGLIPQQLVGSVQEGSIAIILILLLLELFVGRA